MVVLPFWDPFFGEVDTHLLLAETSVAEDLIVPLFFLVDVKVGPCFLQFIDLITVFNLKLNTLHLNC